MSPAVRRLTVGAGWAGLVVLQVAVALAYSNRGTWWHYLLHQSVGWGAGLVVAALVAAHTRYRVPVVPALLGGQLASIAPDLMFLYGRMPHEPSMDVWLGHISIHRGPSPVLVALAAVLLGGWAHLAAVHHRRRLSTALAAAAVGVVTAACLLAAPLPQTLEQFPRDSAPVQG